MKLVNSKIFLEIDIYENKPAVLVLENPEIMTEVVEGLYHQYNGVDGGFVLVENEKICSLEKSAEIIINPFSINFNAKKYKADYIKNLLMPNSIS